MSEKNFPKEYSKDMGISEKEYNLVKELEGRWKDGHGNEVTLDRAYSRLTDEIMNKYFIGMSREQVLYMIAGSHPDLSKKKDDKAYRELVTKFAKLNFTSFTDDGQWKAAAQKMDGDAMLVNITVDGINGKTFSENIKLDPKDAKALCAGRSGIFGDELIDLLSCGGINKAIFDKHLDIKEHDLADVCEENKGEWSPVRVATSNNSEELTGEGAPSSKKDVSKEDLPVLPDVERTEEVMIGGEFRQKQIYADGSYIIGTGNEYSVDRYFPDGKIETYKREYISHTDWVDDTECHWHEIKGELRRTKERWPDGRVRGWDRSGGYKDYERLLDGTERKWYGSGQMSYEKLPDGTEHEWYWNGRVAYEKLPDGTEARYKFDGQLTYHATKGKEDTVVYLARKRVAQKRMEKENKLSEGKKRGEGVILPKMSKSEKRTEMLRAKREIKKER